MTFLFGGLTGVILASPALDFQLSDSYFVVAHFHYVVFGTVVFAMFAGFYFWWPKLTGRMLDERLGKIHFWMLFIGFHTTFLVQHFLGVQMLRRYADYMPEDGFTLGNQVSTAGLVLLGLSMILFAYNVWKTWRTAPLVEVDDLAGLRRVPGVGDVLPASRHILDRMPRIRSERPAFDLHHPEAAPPGAHDGAVARGLVEALGPADIGGKRSSTSRRGLPRAGNGAHRDPHRGLRLRHGGDLRRLDRFDRGGRVGRSHRPDPRWPARPGDRVVPLDDAVSAGRGTGRPAR